MKHAFMCVGLVALVAGSAMAADIGYWRLDNDAGAANGVAATTVKDECFGNDGTASGSPLYTSSTAPTNIPRLTTPPPAPYYNLISGIFRSPMVFIHTETISRIDFIVNEIYSGQIVQLPLSNLRTSL